MRVAELSRRPVRIATGNRNRWKDYGIKREHGRFLRGKAQAVIPPVSSEQKRIRSLETELSDMKQRFALLESLLKEKLNK